MLYHAQNDNLSSNVLGEGDALNALINNDKNTKINSLKKLVAAIENQGKAPELPVLDTTDAFSPSAQKPEQIGKQSKQAALAGLALETGTVHELWAKAPVDVPAAMALLVSAVATDTRPFLWITSRAMVREHGLPYGLGLQAVGIDPSRLLLVQCKQEKDALWALEEGLKSKALAAVIGELSDMDLTSSRRLILTSREHQTRGLLLMRSADALSTAAYSRWQISASASTEAVFDTRAPGTAVLDAALVKHRGGLRPVLKRMEWPYAPDTRSVAAAMADRPVAPGFGTRQHATG